MVIAIPQAWTCSTPPWYNGERKMVITTLQGWTPPRPGFCDREVKVLSSLKNEPNSTKRGSSSVTLGNNKIGDAWQFDQGATKRGSFLEGEKKIPFHLDRADYRGDFDGTDAVAVDNTKSLTQGKPGKLISKEELGRATWTLLHTIGAQFPDKPTKQQKRDVKELMAILSRIYPCKECADHFKDSARRCESSGRMKLQSTVSRGSRKAREVAAEVVADPRWLQHAGEIRLQFFPAVFAIVHALA
ncbi:hypothetical protein SUGI_0212050, partial [Cryptomeria japonica]